MPASGQRGATFGHLMAPPLLLLGVVGKWVPVPWAFVGELTSYIFRQ